MSNQERLIDAIIRSDAVEVRSLIDSRDVDVKRLKISGQPVADYLMEEFSQLDRRRSNNYQDVRAILLDIMLVGAPLSSEHLEVAIEDADIFRMALFKGTKFEEDENGGNPIIFDITRPEILQIAIEFGININSKLNGKTYVNRTVETFAIHNYGLFPLIEVMLYSDQKVSDINYVMIICALIKFNMENEFDEMINNLDIDMHDTYDSMDEELLIIARRLTTIYNIVFMNQYVFTGEPEFKYQITSLYMYQRVHPDKISTEYIEKWRKKFLALLPYGEDMLGNEGPLFFLHNHSKDEGLTKETIEYQLQKSGPANQNGIPCFYHIIGNASSCNQLITRIPISAIVDIEAWDAWDANGAERKRKEEQAQKNALKLRTGLNEQMPAYTSILRDRKKKQEVDNTIAHSWTMCAFCLLPMERTIGCNYMWHEKPSVGTKNMVQPWCPTRFFVKDIYSKYLEEGRQASSSSGEPINPELDHLETCIECGRPCWRHHHFDLEHPGQLIYVNNNASYKKCPGGGRRELIARILAVREVYRTGGFKTPLEERRAAAWAADAAAKNAALLNKADELLAIENVNSNNDYTRNFKNALPTNKTYSNDPAYQLYEAVKPLADSANTVNKGKLSAANQRIIREDHERIHELAHRENVAAQAAPFPRNRENQVNRQNGGNKRRATKRTKRTNKRRKTHKRSRSTKD